MRRGARFVVLDGRDPRNTDADYVVLEIPAAELPRLREQLEALERLSKREDALLLLGTRGACWCVRLPVEAHHPKAGEGEKFPPSLLKESIPRAGKS